MDSTDSTNLGQKQDFRVILKRRRLAAGWTQEQLAEHAGVSVRCISNLERGSQHVPRGDTIRMIAAALHLTDDESEAFTAAARVRDDAEPVVAFSYGPSPFPSGILSETALSIAATQESVRDVTVVYEFLHRASALLRELGQ